MANKRHFVKIDDEISISSPCKYQLTSWKAVDNEMLVSSAIVSSKSKENLPVCSYLNQINQFKKIESFGLFLEYFQRHSEPLHHVKEVAKVMNLFPNEIAI